MTDAHMIPKALGGRLARRGILCRTEPSVLSYFALARVMNDAPDPLGSEWHLDL
jgi:hypothetical protein